eukprot:TRINITY_DN11635_c0_g2_i1.p1 TRINITY_DN11635_c0_g2~~TRINITY_DN11635_c0_g2_i1.p1  ORF type:complete len:173 (+),score=10.81 TRINITY_DN11635_c0_g2_i1:433-951(+)
MTSRTCPTPNSGCSAWPPYLASPYSSTPPSQLLSMLRLRQRRRQREQPDRPFGWNKRIGDKLGVSTVESVKHDKHLEKKLCTLSVTNSHEAVSQDEGYEQKFETLIQCYVHVSFNAVRRCAGLRWRVRCCAAAGRCGGECRGREARGIKCGCSNVTGPGACKHHGGQLLPDW